MYPKVKYARKMRAIENINPEENGRLIDNDVHVTRFEAIE